MPNDSIIRADAGLPGDGLTIAATGLTAAQTQRRLTGDGPNLLPGGQARTWLAIVAETVREPMFLLLPAAGTLYAVFGDLQEGLTLFGFVVLTLGLTLYHEGNTKRARRFLSSRCTACK